MRIDAHVHFLVYNAREHLWVTDELGALKGTFLPGDLEPLLRDAGFDGCVAVEARQLPHENDWLLDLARSHASIKGVVGWVDLCAPDVTARLEALAVYPAQSHPAGTGIPCRVCDVHPIVSATGEPRKARCAAMGSASV